MKKLLAAIIVSACTIVASAQEFTNTPEFYTGSPYLSIGMVDYLGFGLGASTSMLHNTEFFFNMLYMKFHPYRSGSIGMGLDMHWSGYRTARPYYWRADAYGEVSVADGSSVYSKVGRSVLRIMSFDIPLDYAQQFGPVCATLGVACEINLPGTLRFRGADGSGNTIKEKYRGVDTELITPSFHLYLTYLGMGLYFKYRPVAILGGDTSPEFTTWTAGIILN